MDATVSMDRWAGKVALVTGASCGIGAAITRALIQCGMIVVGCARNVDRIKAIQAELTAESAKFEGKLHAIKCDLTQKEEIAAMFDEIKRDHKVVHVCVNNAGLAFNSPLVTGNPDDWQNMMDVNVMALCRCTQESIKLMRANKVTEGQIIHMNSMSGHRIAGTASGIYSGTKHMVTALTEGLRRELLALQTNIRVCSISPGIVETEFGPRMIREDAATSDYYKKLHGLRPEDVANQVIHILQQPPNVQIHDIHFRPTTQKL